MPNEKAHGIQMAKMCEAFTQAGADLTLVVPSCGSGNLRQFYGLACEVPVSRLPVWNLRFLGPVGYRLTALQFALSALFYMWVKVFLGERFVVYTIDMDSFSFAPLVLVPRPLFAEMHSTKKSNFLTLFFFKHACIIATNQLIGDGLATSFRLSSKSMCIEPNGVDESVLWNTMSSLEARVALALPSDKPFALYVGRFYAWKGLEILAEAAANSSLPIYVVGGTREEYERVTKKSGEMLHFAGAKPVEEIPLWLAAADVLLMLGTAKNEYSYRYTSPMKIFEYLAADRPTVASRTPAATSIMQENTAFWYEPDNAHSLAVAIREAYTSPEAKIKTRAGHSLATAHTWRRRAERILAFCDAIAENTGNT
mgnify:FL=1